MDYENFFNDRETVTVQFCAMSVRDGALVVTQVLETSTVPVAKLPTPAVARSRIGPGEAVVVEDVLYAWVPPESSPVPAEPVEPACASVTAERKGAESAATDSEFRKEYDGSTLDPVDATERLARASFEILRRNDELLERHMRRIADLDERQKKLDQRAEQLARAQVEHLTVLRGVTADVAASVKHIQKAPDPAALPEDVSRARERLADAGAPSVPFAIVASHLGAFLRGAGAEFFFPDVNASPAD